MRDDVERMLRFADAWATIGMAVLVVSCHRAFAALDEAPVLTYYRAHFAREDVSNA